MMRGNDLSLVALAMVQHLIPICGKDLLSFPFFSLRGDFDYPAGSRGVKSMELQSCERG